MPAFTEAQERSGPTSQLWSLQACCARRRTSAPLPACQPGLKQPPAPLPARAILLPVRPPPRNPCSYMAALAASGKKSLAVDIMLRTLGLEMVADTLASPLAGGSIFLRCDVGLRRVSELGACRGANAAAPGFRWRRPPSPRFGALRCCSPPYPPLPAILCRLATTWCVASVAGECQRPAPCACVHARLRIVSTGPRCEWRRSAGAPHDASVVRRPHRPAPLPGCTLSHPQSEEARDGRRDAGGPLAGNLC